MNEPSVVPPAAGLASAGDLKKTQVSTASAFTPCQGHSVDAERTGRPSAFEHGEDPFAAPPASRVPLAATGTGVAHMIDGARSTLEMARRYLLTGGAGFAAASAHLAMMQLADAALFHLTGKFFPDRTEMLAMFHRVVIDAHVLPADCYLHLVDGGRFAMNEGAPTEMYVSPPSNDRARDELTRAEAFLAETVAALGLTRVGPRG